MLGMAGRAFRSPPPKGNLSHRTNQQSNSTSDFRSSPLITPDDLRADPRVASLRSPPGVVIAWPNAEGTTLEWINPSSDDADDRLLLEMEDPTLVVWSVEGSATTPTMSFILDAAFAAILNEATRFDGSLRTHSNRSPGDLSATFYLRFIQAKGAPEEGSFIVARIVVDAEAREVAYSPDSKRDLRQVGLSPDGKRRGKATRNARDALRAHAERSASANAPQGYDIRQATSPTSMRCSRTTMRRRPVHSLNRAMTEAS